jgi:RecJ-like exonuclease
MIAIEHLLVNCELCHVTGMVDGERCPACGGQGLVWRAPVLDDTDLTHAKKADLVAIAEARGLDSSGTRAEILERLEATEEG